MKTLQLEFEAELNQIQSKCFLIPSVCLVLAPSHHHFHHEHHAQ